MLAKIAWAVGITVALALVVAMAVLPHVNFRLWFPDPKPTNVPDDAVPIPYIATGRLWAKCWVEGADTRCRIFNGAGEIFQDDIFITYSRGAAVAASDLVIVPERSGPPDYLLLKTGEILLPKTNYAEHRRNVEKIVQSLKSKEHSK